ncbi:MAG: phosphatase PAP2 family protein, partial [Mariniphaga sp.]|nr:phosphatase PAP2 family protein [Mariniphaga sp.]
ISLKWDVSSHMAALGSLLGVLLALAFRTGTNPVWAIVLVLLTSGIVGWSRLYLNRNKPWQLTAGYATGFIVLYLVIYLI